VPYTRYFMIRRLNQNSTFPKVTCCAKRAKYRCCKRVSNTHVLYDAPYAHTYMRARARTLVRTHITGQFPCPPEVYKIEKRTTSCNATSLLLTNWQQIHFITICTFCRELLNNRLVMILGKWPTWCTNLFYVFISIYNSLHISSTSCSSSGETNCINTASGNCHSENRWVI
jgi:hypothetical protein